MNPFILSFADGTTFFVGLALVLVAEGLLFRFRIRFVRPLFSVAALVGIILVIISATPLPIWAYVIWTIPAVAGLLLLNRAEPARRACWACGIAVLASTLTLGIMEAPFHRRPTLRVAPGATVYVLGDSISAGTGTPHRCWPEVLGELTAFRIVNLAQPGATVERARVQAEGVRVPKAWVIVAIGGNDLLGGTPARTFHARLDALLASLRAAHHDVLLLELPLFPFQNAYGLAQRDAARKHGAAMLPKRCFTRVLGTPGGTLDGLHLSQRGHDTMASIIADVLNPLQEVGEGRQRP